MRKRIQLLEAEDIVFFLRMTVSKALQNGHVKIGKNCYVGAGSVIKNRINIGDNTFISMGAEVTKDVAEGKHVSGNFAIDQDKFIDFIKKLTKQIRNTNAL